MLTLAHKKVTRIALNIYYTMNPDRYIAYEKRCEILNQDGPVRRRASQAAQICIKIIKGEIDMSFGQLIRDHVNTNQERRIRRLLNRTNNNIVPKIPIAIMLAATSIFESVINLNQEMGTISNKIKKFNAVQRSLLADSRRSGRARSIRGVI